MYNLGARKPQLESRERRKRLLYLSGSTNAGHKMSRLKYHPLSVCRLHLRFSCVCLEAQGHDIITTKITWNREISRIVYARCAACHRQGGTAFSLMSYQEARPWAKAIGKKCLNGGCRRGARSKGSENFAMTRRSRRSSLS